MFNHRILWPRTGLDQDQSFRHRPGKGAHNAISGSAAEQIQRATSNPPTRRQRAQMELVSQGFKLLWLHYPEQVKDLWFEAGASELEALAQEIRKLKRLGVRS